MKKRHAYLAVARLSLQNALVYRANVATGFLFYTMFLFVFFYLWRAIYAGGGVAGLSFQQMIWYLCVTELINYGARANVYRPVADKVKSGEIAYELIRPYRYVGFQAASAVGTVAYNFVCFGALALAIGLVMVGPIEGFAYWTLPLSMLSVCLGVALNFFCHLAIALTAFRLEETFGLYLIFQKLVFMLGGFFPVEFLPHWLRGIAQALPFSYVSWGPARLAVDFSWPLFGRVIGMQALWLTAAVFASLRLYRAGMRALQGQGG